MADCKSTRTIVLRKEAGQLGLKHYFTGKPCKRGHISRRHVHNGTCLECINVNGKLWAKRNTQRVAASMRAWRSSHPDRERINKRRSYRRWYAKYGDRIRRKARDEYAADPQKFRQRRKLYAKNNKEKKAARFRRWREKNRDHHRAYNRQWALNNYDKVRTFKRNAKAKRKCVEGSHKAEDIQTIRKAQREQCAYCRLKLGDRFHVDHIQPLCRGGTNDRANLQLLCANCNLRKGASDPLVHAQSLGLLL